MTPWQRCWDAELSCVSWRAYGHCVTRLWRLLCSSRLSGCGMRCRESALKRPVSSFAYENKLGMKYLSRLKHKGIEITVVITALLIIYGGSYLWRARSALGEGKRLYEAGNYSAAVVPLRRYSALAPWDGEGHYWVGNALGFSNRLDEAVVELRRATELEPKDAGYAIALGN